MTETLTLCVRGALVSNNRVTRHVGGMALKSTEARRDQARIAALARTAALVARWQPLRDACALEIVAWNTRKDAGNVEKVIADALSGIAYDDDRRITRLLVEKRRDKQGERYDVLVRAIATPSPVIPPPAVRLDGALTTRRRARKAR